jgi:hypothetical protein
MQRRKGSCRELIERQCLIGIFRNFPTGIQDSYIKASSGQQLTERNFILYYAGADRFAFVHRTFWVFRRLVRRAIERHRTLSPDQLGLMFRTSLARRKVACFLRLIAGMVSERQAGELIAFSISLDSRSHKLANLMLAAGCLSEVRNRDCDTATGRGAARLFFADAIVCPPYYYDPQQEWDSRPHSRQSGCADRVRLAVIKSTKPAMFARQAFTGPDCADGRPTGVGGRLKTCPAPSLLKDRIRSDTDSSVQIAAVQELARGWEDETGHFPSEGKRPFRQTLLVQVAVKAGARLKSGPDTLPWLKDRARFDINDEVRVALRSWREVGR